MLRSIEQELCASLTPAQMEVYRACLLGCVSYKDYADGKGVSYQKHQMFNRDSAQPKDDGQSATARRQAMIDRQQKKKEEK